MLPKTPFEIALEKARQASAQGATPAPAPAPKATAPASSGGGGGGGVTSHGGSTANPAPSFIPKSPIDILIEKAEQKKKDDLALKLAQETTVVKPSDTKAETRYVAKDSMSVSDIGKGMLLQPIKGEKEIPTFTDTQIKQAEMQKPSYTHGTGTIGQLTGGSVSTPVGEASTGDSGGYTKRDMTANDRATAERQEEMAFQKEYYIGKDTSKPTYEQNIYAQKSPYQIEHGYNPAQEDVGSRIRYTNFESDINANISSLQQSQQVIQQSQGMLPGIQQGRQTLQGMAPGSTVEYYELNDKGAQVLRTGTREELLAKYQEQETIIQGNIAQGGNINKQLASAQNLLGQVKGYKELGYDITSTDEGYSFGLPKASTVYQWKHGDMSIHGLASAQFLESPLAIKSFGSALQQLVTGDKKIAEARGEELSEYALGLDTSIRKGEYVGKVLTSGAVVEGVLIPTLTLGAGYALSEGLALGRTATTGLLSNVGSKFTPAGRQLLGEASQLIKETAQPLIKAGEVGGKLMGTRAGMALTNVGMFGLTEGQGLAEVAMKRPEEFGSALAERSFGFGMAIGAMETGFKAGYKPNLSKNIPEIPGSVRQVDVESNIPITVKATQERGVTAFTAEGESVLTMKGAKPMRFDVSAKGISREAEVIKGQPIVSQTEGIGFVKWSERQGISKVEHMKVVDLGGSGYEIGSVGEKRIFYSEELIGGRKPPVSSTGGDVTTYTNRLTGKQYFVIEKEPQMAEGLIEPTTGESLTFVKQVGKVQKYESEGTFSNILNNVMGKQKTRGIITTDGKAPLILDVGKKEPGESLITVTKKGEEKGYGYIERPPADWKLKKKGSQFYVTETVQKEPIDYVVIGSKLSEAIGTIPLKPTTRLSGSALGGLASGGIGAGLITGGRQLVEPTRRTRPTSGTISITEPSTVSRRDMITVTGKQPLIDTGQRGRSSTRTKSLTETGQEQIGGEITKPVSGEIGGLRFGTTEDNRMGIGTRIDLGTRLSEDTSQRQQSMTRTKQLTRSALLTQTSTVTTPQIITPKKPGFFIPPTPRKKKKNKEPEIFKKPKKGRELFKRTTKKRRDKGLPPDILSVTQSHSLYGSATAPRLTKSLYETSAKKAFLRTPTEEMLSGKKQRRRLI